MKDKFNSNNKRIYVVAGSTTNQAWCVIIALVSERKESQDFKIIFICVVSLRPTYTI